MNASKAVVLASMITVLACGCGKSDAPSGHLAGTVASAPSAAVPKSSSPKSSSQLRMRLDGNEWVATKYVSGSTSQPGSDRGILIRGSHFRSDMKEQDFQLMLLGADGPGEFRVSSDDPKAGYANFTSLDERRSVLGAFFGYEIQVKVLKRSLDPNVLEATFSGYMNADNGDRVEISDGYFFHDGSEAN